MFKLSVSNNKGGVCKTTLAVHLAAGIARAGKRTLLVDLDPQGHATRWLNEVEDEHATTERALVEGRIERLAPVNKRENLWMLHATDALSIVDTKLSREEGWHVLLHRALEAHAHEIDAVIFDTPPNLGMSVAAALYTSDAVIAPVTPAFLSLSSLNNLLEKVARIRDRLQSQVEVLGYVLCAADKRDGRSKMARSVLRERFGEAVFDAEIRFSSAAASLPARNALAWDVVEHGQADARGAQDYVQLLDETIARLKGEYTRKLPEVA